MTARLIPRFRAGRALALAGAAWACEGTNRSYGTENANSATTAITAGTALSSAPASTTGTASTTSDDVDPLPDIDASISDASISDASNASPSSAATIHPSTADTASTAPNSTASDAASAANGCDGELLVNADFENAAQGWRTESSVPGIDAIITEDDADLAAQGVDAYNGSGLAWLGGVPDLEDSGAIVTIEQRIQIPEEATRLTFSGYVWVRTEEDDEGAYDAAYVDLLADDGEDSLLWFAHQWTNQGPTEGWVPFEFTTDAVDFAGQTAVLRLHSETDPELVTSFWLDTLSLRVDCGR